METSIYLQSKNIIEEYHKVLADKSINSNIEFIERYSDFLVLVKGYLKDRENVVGGYYLSELPDFKSIEYYKNSSLSFIKVRKVSDFFHLMKAFLRAFFFEDDSYNDLRENKTVIINSLKNYLMAVDNEGRIG